MSSPPLLKFRVLILTFGILEISAATLSSSSRKGLLAPAAYDQLQCYEAALLWARTEGTIPAPETSHAIAHVVREAELAKQEGRQRDILFCYSGHGLMDLVGYQKYLAGELQGGGMPEQDLRATLAQLAGHPPAPERHSGRWRKQSAAGRG